MFTAAEVAQFNRDGYIVARFLAAPADCAAIKAVAERDLAEAVAPVEYETDTQYPGAPVSLDAPGGRTVRRLLQACARDPAIAQWAVQPAIAARLQQLIGPEVELSQAHHNCVMTKNPSYSSITSWHQDIRYWSFERPELVSVWLALGREYFDNGCLLVLPLNGVTTEVGANFSQLAFGFQVTPGSMLAGVVFAVALGSVGGLFPAAAAARKEILTALREI